MKLSVSGRVYFSDVVRLLQRNDSVSDVIAQAMLMVLEEEV